MEKYLYLSNNSLIKSPDINICVNGMYISNSFAIAVNNKQNIKSCVSLNNTSVKKIIDMLKTARNKLHTSSFIKHIKTDTPDEFKSSIKKIIKNKDLKIYKIAKILIDNNRDLKYISELDTIIFLFLIEDNDIFRYLHEEYLSNIKKFIEKKYFKDFNIINFNNDDKIKVLNKIIFNTFRTRNIEDFIEYLKLEVKIYLRLRNSYNIRIKEIRRRIEYNLSNICKSYKGNKLYEFAYVGDFDNIEMANRIMTYLKDNNLVPSDATIEDVTNIYLNEEIIKKIKEDDKWLI